MNQNEIATSRRNAQIERNRIFFSETQTFNVITVEPFTFEDISENYLSWFKDSSHLVFSDQQYFSHTRLSSEEYVFTFHNSPNLFLKLVKSGVGIIGTATIYIDSLHLSSNIGILLDPKWSGKGLGTICWDFLVNQICPTIGIRKASAGTVVNNLAMIRLFEKSGMTLEATLRNEKIYQGKSYDVAIFSKFFEKDPRSHDNSNQNT